VLTPSHPPKTSYLQQAWRWLHILLIVIVVNVLLVCLLLQFIIIPYLIKAGNVPNNTSLDLYIGSAAGIFSPIAPIFRFRYYLKFATPSVPPEQPRHMAVYL
jgi:hypothetical protein